MTCGQNLLLLLFVQVERLTETLHGEEGQQDRQHDLDKDGRAHLQDDGAEL